MKTRFFFFFLIFILVGCKTLKQSADEIVTDKKGCEPIEFVNGIPHIETIIDGKPNKLIFDTGSNISIIMDSTIISSFENKDFGSLGSVKGADGKKTKNRTFTTNIKTNLFESENMVMIYVNQPKAKCNNNPMKGLIGLFNILSSTYSIHMNFGESSLCNLDENEKNEMITKNGFEELKCEYKNSIIYVFLEIENKEYKFKLDTGFTENIVVPYSKEIKFENRNYSKFEGSFFKSLSSETKGNESIYADMPIKIGNQVVYSNLNSSSSIKSQNIGIGFIKGFDWIIDYKNKKLFYKKNKNRIETSIKYKNPLYSNVVNDKLVVIIKNSNSNSAFNLGDEITSINSKKVTPENICEMQNLLNSTTNWETLNLEVIPSKTK
ncbi:MAG: hypothetical protein V4648_02555 [Bacteroidota bacterium]